MLSESVEALAIHPAGVYVDVTFGGGGHSSEILKHLETGKLYSFDQDSDAEAQSEKLEGPNFQFVKANFRYLKKFLRLYGVKQVDGILADLGVVDPVLDIAKELEEAALTDPYFVERKLYPNVDFYSGIIYRAMGIPTEMFTVMFALGRLPGWIAQWKELRTNKEPIGRPRQIYTGETVREYTPMSDRK